MASDRQKGKLVAAECAKMEQKSERCSRAMKSIIHPAALTG
jgi:hypothetical protein